MKYSKNCVIVYYVPRQSGRCSYEDAEFNIGAKGEDGKTAFEYKKFDCLGIYDTLKQGRVSANLSAEERRSKRA